MLDALPIKSTFAGHNPTICRPSPLALTCPKDTQKPQFHLWDTRKTLLPNHRTGPRASRLQKYFLALTLKLLDTLPISPPNLNNPPRPTLRYAIPQTNRLYPTFNDKVINRANKDEPFPNHFAVQSSTTFVTLRSTPPRGRLRARITSSGCLQNSPFCSRHMPLQSLTSKTGLYFDRLPQVDQAAGRGARAGHGARIVV